MNTMASANTHVSAGTNGSVFIAEIEADGGGRSQLQHVDGGA